MTANIVIIVLLVLGLAVHETDAMLGIFRRRRTLTLIPLDYSANDILRNLEYWEADHALMFYAPWCKYCKQLTPGWTLIRNKLNQDSLRIGKLDCEGSPENADFCQSLAVDRYPSLYYFGYGNFHQNIVNITIATSKALKVARYEGDLYLDALYDWVWLLHKISWFDRIADRARTSFLNPWALSAVSKKIKRLENTIATLKSDVDILRNKVQSYETIALFDAMELLGDVFAKLHDEDPSDKNLVFRVCVAQVAEEYCRYVNDDPYCYNDFPPCKDTFFEAKKCRPKICPIKERGCRVVSACLQDSVLNEFSMAIASNGAGKLQ